MPRAPLLLLAAALAWAAATPAGAQTDLNAGDRVRVRAGEASGQYAVVAAGPDGVTLRRGTGAEPIHLAPASIRRLDLYRGPRPAGQGALRGMGHGFLIGAGAGAALGLLSGTDDPGDDLPLTAGEKAFGFGVVFGVSGAVLGAVIGVAAPGERWERVRTVGGVRLGVAPGGRAGLVLSYGL
jgi:hypothetical protein